MTRAANQVKAIAYCRVSTLLGQDANLQLVPIRQFAEARGFHLVNEYVDQGVSGSRERRPALDQLLKDAHRGDFKIIIVAALDRIGRSTKHILNLLDELKHYGISIISLRENLDFSTPAGQMALTVLLAVATLERQILSERVKSALAAKKVLAEKMGSPWRCGRPNVVTEAIAQEVLRLRAEGLSIRGIEKAINKQISKTSIERVLKAKK